MKLFRNLFKSKKRILCEKQSELARQKNVLFIESEELLVKKKSQVPVINARDKLSSTLSEFKRKRDALEAHWEQAYANFSWWNKLKYEEKLDLSDLNQQIRQLKKALNDFDEMHTLDYLEVEAYFSSLHRLSKERIEHTYQQLLNAVNHGVVEDIDKASIVAAWFATLSIPLSIADDLQSANKVYDALRSVNGNFEHMSNSDIWWETLWMSSESLSGLVNLTKGAYFEQLVANDNGGELFEYFNNPDTDIIIDGVGMQIKATDSVSYIASVNEGIPIIATTEVADKTEAIDSGYTNEELNNTVEQALGSTVIDAQDTAIDALLTGVGSLGVFATIQGINHASRSYDKGVEAELAFFEGAGVAIEGTAKGIVDASEFVYKAAMSRPSRLIGRSVLRGLKKLDEKLFE